MLNKITTSIIATSFLVAGTSVCFAADGSAAPQEGALAPGAASGVSPAENTDLNTGLEIAGGLGVLTGTILLLTDHDKGHASTRTTHSPS